MLAFLYISIILVLILVTRILVDDKERHKWQRYLPCFSDPVDRRHQSRHANGTQRTTTTESAPQLSREQDASLRKAVLTARMQHFSLTLTLAHLRRPRSHTAATCSLSSYSEELSTEGPTSLDVQEATDTVQHETEEVATTTPTAPKLALRNADVEAGVPVPDQQQPPPQQPHTDTTEEAIQIPLAGEDVHTAKKASYRSYTNSCSICLGAFGLDEEVAWSSNTKCAHVFHVDCIQDWLIASGYKHYKRQARLWRKGQAQHRPDQRQSILTAPMECPCCRQAFLNTDKQVDDETLKTLDFSIPVSQTSLAAGEASEDLEGNASEPQRPYRLSVLSIIAPETRVY